MTNTQNDPTLCPVCGNPLSVERDNVGFTEPEGPSLWETHVWCSYCEGRKVDTQTEYGEVIPETNVKSSIIL